MSDADEALRILQARYAPMAMPSGEPAVPGPALPPYASMGMPEGEAARALASERETRIQARPPGWEKTKATPPAASMFRPPGDVLRALGGAPLPAGGLEEAARGAGRALRGNLAEQAAEHQKFLAPPGVAPGAAGGEEPLQPVFAKPPAAGAVGGGAGGMSDEASRKLAEESMGMPLPWSTQLGLDVAKQEQRGAMGTASEHQAGAAEAQAAAFAQQAEAQRAAAALDQHAQAEQAALEKEERGKFERLAEDVRSRRVDPDRIWKDRGTAAHVVANLGAALGAFAASMHGGNGRNWAQENIDKAIARDVDAQHADLEQGRGRLEDAKGAYAMLRQAGMDAQAARHGAALVLREQAQTQLAGLMAKGASLEARDRGALLMAQLKNSDAKDEAALQREVGARAFAFRHPKPGPAEKPHKLSTGEERDAHPNAAFDALGELHRDANGEIAGTGMVARALHSLAGGRLDSVEARDNRAAVETALKANAHQYMLRGQAGTDFANKQLPFFTTEDVDNYRKRLAADKLRVANTRAGRASEGPREVTPVDTGDEE